MAIWNFGKNVCLQPAHFFEPKSESELLDVMQQHRGKKIRAIGRLHSWSDLIRADEVAISLAHLKQVQIVSGNDETSAIVGAGCQIKRLLSELQQQQLTLPSIGLITEQTVAGAISTGTHGSGRHCISHYIQTAWIARFDQQGRAEIIEVSDGNELAAAKCSLGRLGVIVRVKIAVRTQYQVEEKWREFQRVGDLLKNESDYPLTQFYVLPWRWTALAHLRRETSVAKSRWAGLYHWYTFSVIDVLLHLNICLVARYVRLPWLVKLLHRHVFPWFVMQDREVVDDSAKMLVMKHELFRHIEIELFVQRRNLQDALDFVSKTFRIADGQADDDLDQFAASFSDSNVKKMLESLKSRYCHHYPICIRRIKQDDTMMSMTSPANRGSETSPTVEPEDWYSISIISYARVSDRAGFELTAKFLADAMSKRFEARPHWGKYCPLSAAELAKLYPRSAEFQAICQQADPQGFFATS